MDRRDQDHGVFTRFIEWMRDECGITVPTKFAVCGTCEGKGTHVNPSIDAHGIGADEWAEWDQEDREAYMRGRYDVRCYECNGRNVVTVLDTNRASPEMIKEWEQWERGHWEAQAQYEAEQRMGA
jgi:hypothetical protein